MRHSRAPCAPLSPPKAVGFAAGLDRIALLQEALGLDAASAHSTVALVEVGAHARARTHTLSLQCKASLGMGGRQSLPLLPQARPDKTRDGTGSVGASQLARLRLWRELAAAGLNVSLSHGRNTARQVCRGRAPQTRQPRLGRTTAACLLTPALPSQVKTAFETGAEAVVVVGANGSCTVRYAGGGTSVAGLAPAEVAALLAPFAARQ